MSQPTASDQDRGAREGSPSRARIEAAAVGLGTLLVHLWVQARWPIGRFLKYPRAAELRLAGELPAERLTDFSPLYLELCTLLARVFDDPQAWLGGLQLAMVGLGVACFYRILLCRFGRSGALVGAALLAFDRRLLIYGRIFEPEAPMLLLVTAFVLVIARVPARPDAWPRAALAGLLAALAIATRPTFLPLFLLVPGLFVLDLWRSDEKTAASSPWARLRPALWPSVAFLAPVGIVLLALALRAASITGSATTPVMNPGTVFFEGNQPLSMGTSAIYPPGVLGAGRPDDGAPDSAHENYRRVARAVAEPDTTLSVAEVNAFWSGRARAFFADYPDQALDRILRKLRYSVHSFAWHDLPASRGYDLYFPWPSLPFALLAALALAGMALESSRFGRRPVEGVLDRTALLYYGLAAAQWATLLVFYVSSRQRLGLVPAFLFFALVALEAVWQGRRRWAILGVAAVLTVTGSLPDDAMLDERYRDRLESALRPGLAALQRSVAEGTPAALSRDRLVGVLAIAPFARGAIYPAFVPSQPLTLAERIAARTEKALAVASETEVVPVAFDLASLWLEIGRYDDVVELMTPLAEADRIVYRGGRGPSTGHFFVGRASILGGREGAGRRWLERGLERHPGDAFLLAELYALTDDAQLGQQLERYYGGFDARWLTAGALHAQGQWQRAAVAYASVVDALPSFRPARLGLASSLGRLGRLDEGMEHLRAANALGLEPVAFADGITELVQRWADSRPEEPFAQAEAASILFQFGRLFDARHRLEGPALALGAELDRSHPGLRSRVDALRQRIQLILDGPAEPPSTPEPERRTP